MEPHSCLQFGNAIDSIHASFHLYSWGANSYGQLGLGHQEDRHTPTAVDLGDIHGLDVGEPLRVITGGGGHSWMVDCKGSVFTCGNNNKNQLGRTASEDCRVSEDSNGAASRDEIVFTKLHISPPKDIEFVDAACGWEHSMAVDCKGRMYGCGENAFGQVTSVETSIQPTFGKKSNQKRKVSFSASSQPCSSTATPDQRCCTVECGTSHTLVLHRDMSLGAIGCNKRGQLGVPAAIPTKYAQIACGFEHSCAVTVNGRILVWGSNKKAQLGLDPATVKFSSSPTLIDCEQFEHDHPLAVRSGWSHLLAVTESGRVFGWGRADYGQLGLPIATFVMKPPREICGITLDPSHPQIECGSEHTLAVGQPGCALHSWGWNEHGMCGLGWEGASVNRPTLVEKLGGRKVLALGAGAGHCFAMVES